MEPTGTAKSQFRVLQAGLGYSQSLVHFTWAGFDGMDEVSGNGHAELLKDTAESKIEITLTYHNGD
ncbi:hypothetical protein [Sinorhizobium meliloti]|uniref:hypothetical protein n=1 Tax=Rhizobium meliloti TaxID=382 RepID=UPI001F17C6AB|nr:hypothetical protein [Sinorhizobium meliloti]